MKSLLLLLAATAALGAPLPVPQQVANVSPV
jgi:hypothetical protein